jgi:hypothetical protein
LENAWAALPEGMVPATLAVSGSRLAGARPASLRIDLDGAVALPAFINAHDHLELNGLPRTGSRGRYRNAREWFEDVRGEEARSEAFRSWLALPLGVRLAFSGFLNLLNGCLTVAHHNPYYWRHFAWRYPVEVLRRYGWCHSLALEPDPARRLRKTASGAPFMLHFAEGVDEDAQRELDRLLALGVLSDRTVLVHGVGTPPSAMPALARAGAGVVFCPGSNLFLFGRTLAVREAQTAGVVLAVGSDSTLSGEGGFLRELALAREVAGISGLELLRLSTESGARLLRFLDRGVLSEGRRADLLVLDRSVSAQGFCPSKLGTDSLQLIIRGGRPVIAAPSHREFFEKLGEPFVEVQLGPLTRLLHRRYHRHYRILARHGALTRLDSLLAPPPLEG